jgi:nitroimidazol reductase NimA-like FMN-containing flavoprotein (pyridoxamine 5'-phosphate oxidase superfamily)
MSEEYRGKMGGLENEERDEFLAGDALARLAVLKEDGSPYVVPVWYHWDGQSLWFIGRERSQWCSYIQRDPRVAVVIDKEHGRPDEDSGSMSQIPKIMTDGKAEIIETPNIGGKWVAICEKMAVRYLGENGPSYLQSTLAQPRWLIKLTPTKFTTWKGVGWATKYWVEGSGPSFEEAHGLKK